MKQKSMTALVSAFARAYHSEQKGIKIFDDNIAKLLLTEQEYNQIYNSMAQGIHFFNPEFNGNEKDAIQWIVDNQLSPSPLGRSAFAERALRHAVRFGTTQYLILAAGYDSFAYRQPEWASKLRLFEIDHPLMSKDKQDRINRIYGELLFFGVKKRALEPRECESQQIITDDLIAVTRACERVRRATVGQTS